MAVTAQQRHVVQGFDVVTTVTVPVLGGSPVGSTPVMTGKYQEVSFTLTHDPERYLETEEQIAEILDGEFTIEGTLRRGMQSMAILSRLFPNLASGIVRGQRLVLPTFDITMKIFAPEKTTIHGQGLTLVQCKFLNMDFSGSAGKAVGQETIKFAAHGIQAAAGVVASIVS